MAGKIITARISVDLNDRMDNVLVKYKLVKNRVIKEAIENSIHKYENELIANALTAEEKLELKKVLSREISATQKEIENIKKKINLI